MGALLVRITCWYTSPFSAKNNQLSQIMHTTQLMQVQQTTVNGWCLVDKTRNARSTKCIYAGDMVKDQASADKDTTVAQRLALAGGGAAKGVGDIVDNEVAADALKVGGRYH